MSFYDISLVVIFLIVAIYSVRKIVVTDKREKNNRCYRCGVSLEGIEFGYIRDGASVYSAKDRKVCVNCLEATKSNIVRLLLYFVGSAFLAIIIAAFTGS